MKFKSESNFYFLPEQRWLHGNLSFMLAWLTHSRIAAFLKDESFAEIEQVELDWASPTRGKRSRALFGRSTRISTRCYFDIGDRDVRDLSSNRSINSHRSCTGQCIRWRVTFEAPSSIKRSEFGYERIDAVVQLEFYELCFLPFLFFIRGRNSL